MSHRSGSTSNLVDAINASLTGAPTEQNFLIVGDEQLSYSTLRERMARLNGMFQHIGLRAGDRVVIASDNDMSVITIFLALIRVGLTAVIADGKSTPDELLGLLSAADPAAMFADGEPIEQVRHRTQLPPSRIVDLSSFSARLEEFEPLADNPDVPADALALMMFTSGTTSQPKGVSLTHANLSAQLETFAEVYGFDDRSRILNILPLHHVDGLIRRPLAAIRFGAQVCRPMRFSVPAINGLLAGISSQGITHFVTVPAMLNLINRFAVPGSGAFRSPDFRFVICSADFLEPGLWVDFEERFGVTIVNAYGLSECVCDALFCGPGPETRRVGTLGKPVNCQARVVDETGSDVNQEEVGELILSGPIVMPGYFRRPEETAGVLSHGWFHTGDLVSRDRDGFFTFVGRKKSVIISGGATIHPEDITTTLLSMPDVIEAVCFGVADPIWGQRLAACVVIQPSAGVISGDVVEFCREHLAPEKIPADIHIVDGLPRGPSGKILIDTLSEMIATETRTAQPSGNVFTIAAECFQLNADALSPDSTPYNTEGWDSLAHLAFIARLEEFFGIAFSAQEIIELGSLADAEEIVTQAREAGR